MLIDQSTADSIVAETPLSITRLEGRAVLRISGADRVSFLQGLVSNDVTKVAQGQAVYACFLTPQGKFLHEMIIFADDEALYLDTEGGDRAADLLKRLNMYRLRTDVVIDSVEDMAVWAVYGSGAGAMRLPGDVIVAADPRSASMGLRALCGNLTVPGAIEQDLSHYDAYRLRLAIPDGSRDMQIERATLMESGIDLLNGISWDKGCYMGQELTARMKYRNLGKRRLMLFRIGDEQAVLEPGTPVMHGEKAVGELRSVAGGYAFGLVRVTDILDARQLPEICHIEDVELYPISKPSSDIPCD